jgi:hypothetical protein
LALGVIESLWNSSISIECSQWQADIKAGKFYLITWSIGIIGPARGGATIDFDGLVLCGNKDVLLNMGTGTIIAELLSTVIGFGRS